MLEIVKGKGEYGDKRRGYHIDLTMENELAKLDISNGEEEAWQLYEGLETQKTTFDLCLLLDIDRVVKKGTMCIQQSSISVPQLQNNENPMQGALTHSLFWVQVHNLPPEDDAKSNSNGYKNFLRIKVKLNVRSLLKR
ncbi:hypothetical protein J1N35_010611 [Gossypium stocksii]|uniref:Uncharacterized protein n=1 Tax=Gossypium stocksii TaxID=47602 RepID=A0A9D4ACG9_9ROSI|nr:hypothetical protein J1N35_010611 [Gossypium stocksii]